MSFTASSRCVRGRRVVGRYADTGEGGRRLTG